MRPPVSSCSWSPVTAVGTVQLHAPAGTGQTGNEADTERIKGTITALQQVPCSGCPSPSCEPSKPQSPDDQTDPS